MKQARALWADRHQARVFPFLLFFFLILSTGCTLIDLASLPAAADGPAFADVPGTAAETGSPAFRPGQSGFSPCAPTFFPCSEASSRPARLSALWAGFLFIVRFAVPPVARKRSFRLSPEAAVPPRILKELFCQKKKDGKKRAALFAVSFPSI